MTGQGVSVRLRALLVASLVVTSATPLPTAAGSSRADSGRSGLDTPITAASLKFPVPHANESLASSAPSTLDNFNRTTTTPYWGTASSGAPWLTYIPTFCTGYTAAVDGAAGTITGSLGASCTGQIGASQLTNPSSSGLRFWDAPSWQFTGKFKTSAIDDSSLELAVATQLNQYTITGISMSFSASAGSVTLESRYSGSVTAPFTWQANTWYAAKWVQVWQEQARLKVWPSAQAEPPDWLLATTGSTNEAQSLFITWWRSQTGPTKVSVDDFAFGPAPVLPKLPPPPGTEHNPPYENQEPAGDPVNSFTGALNDSHVDVAIPGRGPTVDFARSYNSNDTRVTALGPGWTHSYNIRLVDPNDGTSDVILIGPQGRSDRYVWGASTFAPPVGVHRTLVRNADASYTARDKNVTMWIFDASGRLDKIVDRYGNASTMTYDTSSRLVSISDPAGRGVLTLAYTNGLLTSVSDWASPVRSVNFQYDVSGRLWKAIDREGQTTTFSYDGTSQRISTITNARGSVILTNTYDAQGRVATQQDARGLVTGDLTTFNYVVNPDNSRVTTVTTPPTSFEPAFHPTLVDTYDSNGWLTQRLTKPSTSDNLTQSFTYGAAGDRTSVTDPRGSRTDYCFDVDYSGNPIAGGAANLTRRIDPAPAAGANRPTALFQFDASNNLTQTVAPNGVPSGQTVTCSTNLSSFNATYATDFGYDPSRVFQVSRTSRFTDPDTGPKTVVTKYEYSDAVNLGLLTRTIPPRGNTGPSPDYTYATTSTYYTTGTRAGMLKDVTDPLGNVLTFDYDPVGRVISSVDQLGNPAIGGYGPYHTTTFTYDKEDRMRTEARPGPLDGGAALVTETRYDEVGKPVVRIDANGQVTTRSFDARNSLSQVRESSQVWTDPTNPPAQTYVTEYARDAGGNPTRITRAKGDPLYERVVDYAYDGRGLPRSETQYPSWPATTGPLVTTFAYDAAGNQITALDQIGQTTTLSYDTLNRRTSIDYSDVATADVLFTYDADGNRKQVVDGTGTTVYALDEAGRPVSVTSPGSTTVGSRYDLDGNRTKLIYPDGTAVTYTYNKGGQLASLTDWASRSVTYSYWPNGLIKSALNADASLTTYAYDNAQRLTDVMHTNSAGSLFDRSFYAFDAVGNVTRVNHGLLPAQFARPDGLIGSNGTWTGTYASINEVTPNDASFLASPSGPATPNYYEVSLSDALAPMDVSGIKYRFRVAKSGNDSGQVTNISVEVRDGSTILNTFSVQGIKGASGSGWTTYTGSIRPQEASQLASLANLRLRFTPTSSGGGQARKAQVSWAEVEVPAPPDPAAASTYGYDRLYRLTSASDASGTRTYTYDPVGNRLTKVAGGTTTYTYDRADRMTAAGPLSVTVDAKGNLTARGTDTFAFDQANRLISATVLGSTETYVYDGNDTRFSRKVGANPAVRQISDIAPGLPVTISDGTRKTVYGHGVAYAVTGTAVEVYHTDGLGSVRALTNTTGSVIATYRTDEWGVATATTGSSTQPLSFTGEPRDATGLTYLRARYYDPSLGRFLSRDTWLGAPSEPQTLNHYTYANNNPTTLTDPSGHFVDTLFDIGFIIFDVGSLLFGPPKDRGGNWAALGADVAAAGIPFVTGAGLALRGGSKAAEGIRYLDEAGDLIIGKMDDVGDAAKCFLGDHCLNLPPLPPGPQRWQQNADRLQQAIARGERIRDVSPTRGGGFLERERQLLRDNGFEFDSGSGYWYRP